MPLLQQPNCQRSPGTVFHGGKPGPTILLRGDMDALPMPEDTGLPFASEVSGTMHACGHDAHTAMLVGAAKALCQRREMLAGSVLFMFQPGEEGYHGARVMIEGGLLEGPDAPTGAFAIHITHRHPAGVIGSRGGAAMASGDTIHIVVRGKQALLVSHPPPERGGASPCQRRRRGP